MPLFKYQAADPEGRLVDGVIEAGDEAAIITRLQESGHFPIKIERSADAAKTAGVKKSKRLAGNASVSAAGFTGALSNLLEAGIPLDRSLSILESIEEDAFFREVITDIVAGIRGGKSFADCLEDYPRIFPEIYTNSIRAGEAGGSLEPVLLRLKKYMEDSERLKVEIRSALIYPAILLFAGGSAILVMLLFVLPRFSEVFAGAGGAVPLPAMLLMDLTELLASYWWAIALSFGAAAYAVSRYLGTREGRLRSDALKLRLPVIGPVYRKAVVSRFARTLGTLLHGGLPIIEALKIAVKTTGNVFMSSEMAPLIEGVKRGGKLSELLKAQYSFPPLALHMITVGEETGRLEELLVKLSDTYDRDVSTALKRLLTLLEPAIIIFMAAIIGFIVISLLFSVFSLNDMPI